MPYAPTFDHTLHGGRILRLFLSVCVCFVYDSFVPSVSEAIAQLSEQDRAILMLRDLEGYSTQETAEATGLTESAVKSRLHRARAFLRDILDNQFPDQSDKS